ncbi:hypothetical protein V6N12_074186 [Hibiscus sabdariffa]
MEALVLHLDKLGSDYRPSVSRLSEDQTNKRDRSFRLVNAWQAHPQFSDFLKSVWNNGEPLETNMEEFGARRHSEALVALADKLKLELEIDFYKVLFTSSNLHGDAFSARGLSPLISIIAMDGLSAQEHDGNLNDRLSGLPEDLLVRILCLLSLKEALRTCVLSRKWRHLCQFFSGSLNFDASKTLKSDPKKLLKERDDYVESINRFFSSHKAGTIDELRVCFDLTQQQRRYIDRWIEIALMKKCERLELDFEPCRLNHRRDNENYWLGHKFSSSSETRFLTGLCLKHVDVSGRILESFLSNCTLLETLHVSHSEELTHISVCGSSLRLKYLHVSFCKCIKSIEVYAPNLVSFEYRGEENMAVHIDLKYVPHLCDVSYAGKWDSHFDDMCKSIPSCLATSQLVNLSLSVPYTPRLEAVEAHILTEVEEFQRIIWAGHNFSSELLRCRYKQPMMLREVEMVGFVGAAADTTLVYLLSLFAPNLESIMINRCLPRQYPVDERKIMEFEEARMFAYDLLSAYRPKGAKFLLL